MTFDSFQNASEDATFQISFSHNVYVEKTADSTSYQAHILSFERNVAKKETNEN